MSGNNSLISVLIPAYNHEKYVQETIKSIINQTYQNIELIIIDDGSKDSTWQKIQELKEKCEQRFPRVHFETKGNEGTCQTLNKLISLVQGEYVYIIASDDLAKPQAIEKEVNFLIEHQEYGLVVGDNEIIDSNSKRCYWDEKRNNVYDKTNAEYKTFVEFLNINSPYFYNDKFGTYSTLYIGNYIPNGYMIRKSLFDIIKPFTKEALLEDYFLMLQLSKYCKFKFIDEVLFSYRWHDNNTIKNSEKINMYTQLTKQYEEKILSEINLQKVFPEIVKIKENGVLYKRKGIPFIFELQNYRKFVYKIKILKIFNIKVFKWVRKN